jgi:hypothetical protein
MRRQLAFLGIALIGFQSVSVGHSRANTRSSWAPEPGKVKLTYIPEGLALQPTGPSVSFDDIDNAFIYTARDRRSVFVYATGYEFDGGQNGNRCSRKIPAGVSAKRVKTRVNGVVSTSLYLRGAKLNEFLFPENAIAKPNQPFPSTPTSALLNCNDGNELAISLGKILSPEALARRVENTKKADPTLVMTEWHASSNTNRQTLAWLGDGRSVTVETFWDQRPAEGAVFFATKKTQVSGVPASIEQSETCTTLEWLAQPGARVRLNACGISADETRKIAAGVNFDPLG